MNRALGRLLERVRRGEPLPPALDTLLIPATYAVRAGLWWRACRRRARVEAHVVSIGNLTAGGTGKTPAIIERARRELEAGARVAVLTRGYGTAGAKELTVVRPGSVPAEAWRRIGDEPALIMRKVPGVHLVRGRDRVAAARRAVDELGCTTLLLDDGFQYLRLARDEDVVLIDAANPFGSGRLIPRGLLREPLPALARATALMLTRCDQAANLPALEEQIAALCPGVPVRRTCHAPHHLWRVRTGETLPLDTLAGAPVAVACAIGRPEAFFATLRNLGAELRETAVFPDHYGFGPGNLPASGTVIVTEKDAVRLPPDETPGRVLALAVELTDWPPLGPDVHAG